MLYYTITTSRCQLKGSSFEGTDHQHGLALSNEGGSLKVLTSKQS